MEPAQPSPYWAHDARSGRRLGRFQDATKDQLDTVMATAAEAAPAWAATGGDSRATLLRAIAARLESRRHELVAAAEIETALGPTRLDGEITRTVNQLNLFADLAASDGFPPVIRDRGSSTGGVRPVSLLRVHVPLGPVVVFAASNFPFAFSVAGTDTASALAAGCPVVVKIHPLHPNTSELTAEAVRDAVRDSGAPVGVFDALHGNSAEVGTYLTRHRSTAAVAFTGSRNVGLHLARLAAERPMPIPFYGEFGSCNPVVVCPGAWERNCEDIVERLAASMLQGYGQFCTSPGLILSFSADAFATRLAARLEAVEPLPMLGERIASTYSKTVDSLEAKGIPQLVPTRAPTSPAVFLVQAEEVLGDPALSEEIFGPACVVVAVTGADQLWRVIACLGGQLTGTVFAAEGDEALAASSIPALSRICGRVIWNDVPTGVAVSPAMHHGGPYPATTQPGSTSVGAAALYRFLRPICFQDVPEALAATVAATSTGANRSSVHPSRD